MSKPVVFGMVLFLLLAAQGAPVSAQSGETLPLQAPAGVPDGPAALPPGWQEVMTEDFEGAWPGSGWDVPNTSNGYKWAANNFRFYSGSQSAWPAANLVDPEFNPYPSSMDTQMIYGPFDLSDAVDAQVTFWLWLWTEDFFNADYFWYGVSRDGVTFDEKGLWEGNLSDWTQMTIDLLPYSGDNSLWLRWDFYSDLDVEIMSGGAYVDDITISKLPLTAPTVTISRSGSTINLSWAAVPNATGYEVWWGVNTPYFTPGTTCPATNCAVVTSPSYPHANSVSTASNYTYVVRAVKSNSRSAFGNRVAEFDFTLVR